jgi:hypothetical protein
MENYIIDLNVDTVLTYCDFGTADSRARIAMDGFNTFDDIMKLDEKDVSSLADGFSSRTVATGKIIFGLRRTKLLKAAVNWIQDFGRISREPTLEDIEDVNEFRQEIEEARMRAKMRKQRLDQSDKTSTVTSPGKLKSMKDWPVWIHNLYNYLSTIPGHNGTPLCYLLRESDAPDYTNEATLDFLQLMILCTPMHGVGFREDASKLHHLIHGFVQGETAEAWLKANLKKCNGRIDIKGLEAHYGGQGNKSILIKEAEALRKNLVYKNERTLKLESFLTTMEAMFESFATHDEGLTNAQKVRMLFDKIQHPALESVKHSLQIAYQLSKDGSVDYTFIVQSFATEVAGFPEFTPAQRSVSGVSGGKSYGGGEAPANGIRHDNGKIFTGYYKEFRSLSQDDKNALQEERLRLNIGPSKKKNQQRRASKTSTKKKSEVKKLHKQISSLQSRIKESEKKRDGDDDDDDSEVHDNAGDQFGGRQNKKAKKNR